MRYDERAVSIVKEEIETYPVTVTVVDEDGYPIEGASVYETHTGAIGYTDSDGFLSWDSPYPNIYLTITKNGYKRWTTPGYVSAPIDLTAVLVSEVMVTYGAEFTSLNVPSEAREGATVMITGTLKNTGTGENCLKAVLEVDDIHAESTEYTLAPGGSHSFSLSFTMPNRSVSGSIWIYGEHSEYDLRGVSIALSTAPPKPKIPWEAVAIIVAALLTRKKE